MQWSQAKCTFVLVCCTSWLYHVLVRYSLEANGKNSNFFTCYNIPTHCSLTYHTPGECGSLVVEYQSNQDTFEVLAHSKTLWLYYNMAEKILPGSIKA